MDIKSFKGILKDYNAGKLILPDVVNNETAEPAGRRDYRDDDPALTRDCSYYESLAMAEVRR